jgi:hypothetical protein
MSIQMPISQSSGKSGSWQDLSKVSVPQQELKPLTLPYTVFIAFYTFFLMNKSFIYLTFLFFVKKKQLIKYYFKLNANE